MSKGKRLRNAKKMKMMEEHFKKMQMQESIRRAFSLTPIARMVRVICQNWGKL